MLFCIIFTQIDTIYKIIRMNRLFILCLCSLLLACQQNRKTEEQQGIAAPVAETVISSDTLLFNNDTISIYKIDSPTFFGIKAEYQQDTDTLPYIEDIMQVKALLKEQVLFGQTNLSDGKIEIDTIGDGSNLYAIRSD